MQDAFARAGLPAARIALRRDLALAVNRAEAAGLAAATIGGELALARKMLDRGHETSADDDVGQVSLAPARQLDKTAGGHGEHAGGRTGPREFAPPASPERGDADQMKNAGDRTGHRTRVRAPHPDRDGGHTSNAGSNAGQSRAAPAREPTVADRAAMLRTRTRIAVTVLDSFRVRDGRPIGDVTFGELAALRGANLMEASLCRLIERHIANPAPDTKIRDAINADTLQRMIQKSAEIADAL